MKSFFCCYCCRCRIYTVNQAGISSLQVTHSHARKVKVRLKRFSFLAQVIQTTQRVTTEYAHRGRHHRSICGCFAGMSRWFCGRSAALGGHLTGAMLSRRRDAATLRSASQLQLQASSCACARAQLSSAQLDSTRFQNKTPSAIIFGNGEGSSFRVFKNIRFSLFKVR